MPDFQSINLHVVANISGWCKSCFLFYNDEEDVPLMSEINARQTENGDGGEVR